MTWAIHTPRGSIEAATNEAMSSGKGRASENMDEIRMTPATHDN